MTLSNIVDQFSQVVAAVSSVYGQTVHFRHGHMVEVAGIVQQMVIDPDVDKRYPIIALQHDFEQDPVAFRGTELKGLKLYIITLSRPEYIAEQRKELIFKPILYPIRDLFIEQIARSRYFEQQTEEEVLDVITLTDRYYWGSSTVMGNTANIFSDWVDCIEIDIDGLISFGAACGTAITYPRLVNVLTDVSGQVAFINFDTEMSAPDGLHEHVTFNSSTFDEPKNPFSLTVSNNDKSFIAQLAGITITNGIDLTVTIDADTFESLNGVQLKPVTDFYVQNNTDV